MKTKVTIHKPFALTFIATWHTSTGRKERRWFAVIITPPHSIERGADLFKIYWSLI